MLMFQGLDALLSQKQLEAITADLVSKDFCADKIRQLAR